MRQLCHSFVYNSPYVDRGEILQNKNNTSRSAASKRKDSCPLEAGALILACIGSAVGMGNIWLFPTRVSAYGGATFIIPYLIFVLLIGSTGRRRGNGVWAGTPRSRGPSRPSRRPPKSASGRASQVCSWAFCPWRARLPWQIGSLGRRRLPSLQVHVRRADRHACGHTGCRELWGAVRRRGGRERFLAHRGDPRRRCHPRLRHRQGHREGQRGGDDAAVLLPVHRAG